MVQKVNWSKSIQKNIILHSGEINHLLELDGAEDYVSSVRWMPEGDILAVGNSQGEIGLWDVVKNKQVHSYLLLSNAFKW